MPSKRLSVVVTRRLPEVVETRLTELFDVRLREADTPMSRQELAAAMQEADVIVPTLSDTIDAGLISGAGERLKLIANYGAGVDHIDVATARSRGVLVSNTPGVSAEDTADMAMSLILAVTRRIPEGLALMQTGDWGGWSPSAGLAPAPSLSKRPGVLKVTCASAGEKWARLARRKTAQRPRMRQVIVKTPLIQWPQHSRCAAAPKGRGAGTRKLSERRTAGTGPGSAQSIAGTT